MLEKPKRALASRPVFLTGSLAAVFVAGLLIWVELAAPTNLRLPVPSLDGKYFAYFDIAKSGATGEASRFDLIVSTPGGNMLARFPLSPGPVFWSSAGHLAVANDGRSQATLIPNVGGRFLVLTALALREGTEPRWSRDGTKLAYLRPSATGVEMAIYDFQQTQASAVPLPPEFRLEKPALLFWSPGREEVYFLNSEGQDVVFEKVDVLTGRIQVLAKGSRGWGSAGLGLPRISSDGTKIYLPQPRHSVIDAQTGETVWALPRDSRALWSPWTADGRRLLYARQDSPHQIFVHDFSDQTDQVILTGAERNGFLTVDGKSYLFRTHQTFTTGFYGSGPGLRQWLKDRWGWQHADLPTQSVQPLGRVELWPWEQTEDGRVLARQDEYTEVRFGLYDPTGRTLSAYVFPTDQEDVFRQVKSHSVLLFTILLYALLGFLVYLSRPGSPPARALARLSFILMLLFASADVLSSSVSLLGQLPFPFGASTAEAAGLDWLTGYSFYWLLFDEAILYILQGALALVPPALLHFAIVFPEGSQYLARRKLLLPPLYAAAFLPALGMVFGLTSYSLPRAVAPVVQSLVLVATAVALVTALLALLYNYRHPPDRRARDQVRWVAMAFLLPFVGGSFLLLINVLASDFLGTSSHFLDVLSTATLGLLCLFTPLAIGYALVAHKLFDIQLLIRRTVRYSLMTFLVVIVYLLLVGGLSWGIAGSLRSPSQFVVIASTLLTAAILAPARRRVESLIDRTFDRTKYDFREALQNFATELPNILDRQTLANRMSETVRKVMKARRFYLFVLDRHSRKLRPQRAGAGPVANVAGVEFDPAESLCRYLLDSQRPFEAEISPYDPKLVTVFRSAADRLGQLQAALVFGLERRGELVGLMVVGPKASDEFYNSEDLELLQTVAHQAAVAIENTDLFEEVAQDRELKKELEVASEVQAQLFPTTVPQSASCQIVGRCVAARSVSGDYYDFLELPGKRIGLAIGDVSGKGMSASLLMANLQGLLRSQAPIAETPADLARRINRQLYGSSRGAKYCTFFYGVYHEAGRKLEFVNAGHNPPLLLNGGETRFLESTGIPLGLFPEVDHEIRSEILEPGARVVLYSDGITEARNKSGEFYGVDRLVSVVWASGDLDGQALADKILTDVSAFSGRAEIEDDQTLVLLKVLPA